jgi:hypothetical protein
MEVVTEGLNMRDHLRSSLVCKVAREENWARQLDLEDSALSSPKVM